MNRDEAKLDPFGKKRAGISLRRITGEMSEARQSIAEFRPRASFSRKGRKS
jgi:hypothetical protein